MLLGVVDLPTYILGTIVIVLLPGPNSLYVLTVAAQRGVRAGYAGACGIFLGDLVLMVLAATGVASLLKTAAALFLAFKYAGAAYLMWMGVGLLRSAWATWRHPAPLAGTAPQRAPDMRYPFRSALSISLMNPKAIMFFVSFFIQFVDPLYPWPALSFALLGAICQLLSALYLSVLIFGGAHLAQEFRARRRLAAGATGGVGALFIGFGGKLAVS